MFHGNEKLIGNCIYTVVCTPAVIWGRRPEKRVGAALILEVLATFIAQDHSRMQAVQYALFFMDAGLLAYFLWVAMTSDARWVLFATAFQLLDVATHLAKMLDPRVGGWAYLTAPMIWGYAVVAALLVGTSQSLTQRISGKDDDVSAPLQPPLHLGDSSAQV